MIKFIRSFFIDAKIFLCYYLELGGIRTLTKNINEAIEMNEKLAIELFSAGIPIFGEFPFKLHEKYPRAPKFLMKLNLRKPPDGNLTNKILLKIGRHFNSLVSEKNICFNLLVGLPKAGCPLVQSFVKSDKRLSAENIIFLQKDVAPGQRRISPKITGAFTKGDVVLVVDDVISWSDTKIEGFEALKLHELIVTDCIVFMDWELGGVERLAEYGVKAHAVCTVSKLLQIWEKNELITKEKCRQIIDRKNEIKEYIENC